MAIQCCGEHMHTAEEMRIHNETYHASQPDTCPVCDAPTTKTLVPAGAVCSNCKWSNL